MNMKSLKNITVLYNKTLDENYSADVDTTISAKEIAGVLSQKYSVELLGILPSDIFKIKKIKSDLVFNFLEWTGDNYIYALEALRLLEKLHLPFTGSDAKSFALSGNKSLMKSQLRKHQIPTPNYQIFNTVDEKINNDLIFPVIVKPTLEHCGLGISQKSIAKNKQELLEKVEEFITTFRQPILVEEFIDGRELHVTVFERNGKPWVLPPAEVVFKKEKNFLPILSYEGKWDETSEEYSRSWMEIATLSDDAKEKIDIISKKTYKYLGGRDYPRLDMRIRDNDVFVLEINNNPGIDFSLESGFGLSSRAAGFDYLGALSHIVENAYLRRELYDTVAI